MQSSINKTNLFHPSLKKNSSFNYHNGLSYFLKIKNKTSNQPNTIVFE